MTLNSEVGDTMGILKNGLFLKDSYDEMDRNWINNIRFDRRYKTTMKGNTMSLEGPIGMDICQKNDSSCQLMQCLHEDVHNS